MKFILAIILGACGPTAVATTEEPWEPCMGLKSSQCAYDHRHNDGPLQYNYSFKMVANNRGGIVTTRITHAEAHDLLGLP